jgi:hypothetical protein
MHSRRRTENDGCNKLTWEVDLNRKVEHDVGGDLSWLVRSRDQNAYVFNKK